ncbi:TonB family protein [Sterolibacterium denitrificans]|uniref:TonB family protein n=1 Tax=Sterolibacterium denitrificans TaxID=157592 RepID=A0A7Z7HS42_9PROT|nr:energy transducer TonB [Sterolibacterium denitrificans]SMB28684.1 TonB family protein [Sterolibacterium denitrificans]
MPNEEFLAGAGAERIRAAHHGADSRWLRGIAQWTLVVAAHAVILWGALQISPQARQAVGEIIQATLIAPQAQPQLVPPPPEPPRPKIVPKLRPTPPAPVLAAAPRDEAPAAAFIVDPPPAEPAPAAPAATAAAAQAEPAPLIPPIFNADYLDNPSPIYPALSRQRGETGRVLLHVHILANGRAERVELKTSSGFERLDRSALEAVARWRFVPARRGNERLAAWVLVPISFVM